MKRWIKTSALLSVGIAALTSALQLIGATTGRADDYGWKHAGFVMGLFTANFLITATFLFIVLLIGGFIYRKLKGRRPE